MCSSDGGDGGKGSECSEIKVCLGEMDIGHVIVCSDLCDARSNDVHGIRFVRHNASLGNEEF